MAILPNTLTPHNIALPRKNGEPPQFILPEIPMSVDARGVVVTPGDPTLNAASVALGVARGALERTRSTCEAIFNDPTLTMAARHVAAEKAVDKISKAAFEQLDAATTRLNTEMETLKAKISSPPAPPWQQASEIRRRLAEMDEKQRRLVLVQAMEPDGDDVILASVLTATPMLSGLTKAEVEGLRGERAAKKFPNEVKRVMELERAFDALALAGKQSLEFSMKCYDRQIVENAKALQNKARSAVASLDNLH